MIYMVFDIESEVSVQISQALESSRQPYSIKTIFEREEKWIILSLFLLSLFLRFALIIFFPYNLFPDGYTHLRNALLIRQGIFELTLPWGWLVLYYFFLAPFLVSANPLLISRIISAIMWSFSTILIYILTRQLDFTEKISAFAALLFSLIPYNLIISSTTMNDDLLVVFFFSSLLFLVRFSKSTTFWNGLGLVISLTIASFSRMEGFILAVIITTILCYKALKEKNLAGQKLPLTIITFLIVLIIAVFLHINFLLSPQATEPGEYLAYLLSPSTILESLTIYGKYLASLPSMVTPLILFLSTIGILLLLTSKPSFEIKSMIFISLVLIFVYPALLLPRMGEFVLHAFPKYHVYVMGLLCILSSRWLVPVTISLVTKSIIHHPPLLKIYKYKVRRSLITSSLIFLILFSVLGITAQSTYLEITVHSRIMSIYYYSSNILKQETNSSDVIVIQKFARDGIIYHSGLSNNQVITTEELPNSASATYSYLITNNVTYIVWSLRDEVCRTNPLLALLEGGEDQTNFVLIFRHEECINNLHELVMIYAFIP